MKKHRENTDHFLTCTSYTDMTQSQKQALSKLLKKYNIDPHLRILIFRIAEGKPCDTQALLQANPQFPIQDYILQLKSQQRFGWVNFLKGFPRKHWITHQERYRKELFLKKKPGSNNWLSHVHHFLYINLHSRWKYRNSLQHGNDSYFTKQLLIKSIEGLYSLQT